MTPADHEVAGRLRAILASPEFHPRASDWLRGRLESAINRAFHWLGGLDPAERWALLAFCLAGLAAIAIHVWLTVRPAAAPGEKAIAAGGGPEGGASPETLVARADALAREGRFREAARLLHEAALLRLSRARGLGWRADRSDWEWVAALPAARGLPELTRAAERVAYGPAADAAAFAACRRGYDALAARPAEGPQPNDRQSGGRAATSGPPPGGPLRGEPSSPPAPHQHSPSSGAQESSRHARILGGGRSGGTA